MWAVAQTVPNLERAAEQALADQGYDKLLPQIEHWRIVRGKRARRPLILFPGYLFVRIQHTWPDLWRIPEIIRLVNMARGEDPTPRLAAIPESYVDGLRAVMAEHGGMVPLPKHTRFQTGQRVGVTDEFHPFFGHEGLFDGQSDVERVRVLFNLMGRQVPVTMSERDLIAA